MKSGSKRVNCGRKKVVSMIKSNPAVASKALAVFRPNYHLNIPIYTHSFTYFKYTSEGEIFVLTSIADSTIVHKREANPIVCAEFGERRFERTTARKIEGVFASGIDIPKTIKDIDVMLPCLSPWALR